jgi:hypothetical protein
MVRGGPVKRTRTISARVTPSEWEAWDRCRHGSGRKEMGAFVRAVVNAAVGYTDTTAGEYRYARRPPDVPAVNRDAYRQLVGAANNLNQLTRAVHASAPLRHQLRRTLEAVEHAAMAVVGR